MERLSVSEAATKLGVTPDAVRQRIRRDTIEYEKTEYGRYYVYLTKDDARRIRVNDSVQDALVDRLKDENEFLRRELERKDAILLSMTAGLKALEAPSEPRATPATASEEKERGDVVVAPESEQRSWWQRWFGGK